MPPYTTPLAHACWMKTFPFSNTVSLMTIGTLSVIRARQQSLHSPISSCSLAKIQWSSQNHTANPSYHYPIFSVISTHFSPRQPLPSLPTPIDSSGDLWRQETMTGPFSQRKLIYLLIYLHPRVSIASSGTLCHQNCCCISTTATYQASVCTSNSPEPFFIIPLAHSFMVFFLGRSHGQRWRHTTGSPCILKPRDNTPFEVPMRI